MIIKELAELKPIREDKFVLDLIMDTKDKVVGLSIKDKSHKKPKEVMWLEEDKEDSVLNVEVHPEVSSNDSNTQEFWTILYCVASNVKKVDGDVWDGISSADIAEEIYNSHTELDDEYKDIDKTVRNNLEKKTLPEKPKEEFSGIINVDIDVDEVVELALTYDDEEVEVIVDFLNNLSNNLGLDIGIDILKEDDELVKEDSERINTSKEEDTKGLNNLKSEIGIMGNNYVNHNISTLINAFLQLEGEVDKDTIIFLNQLTYERVQIDNFLTNLISGEDIDD